MSEFQPTKHELLRIINGNLVIENVGRTEATHHLTPDEAVALGFALFEHGLFLKGKMKSAGEKNAEG